MMRVFIVMLILCVSVPALAQDQDLLDGLLGDIPSVAEQPAEEAPLEEQIHPAYLNEADLFYQHCEATYELRSHHDCECLAAHFLDERINRGADASRRNIMQGINTKCLDASEEAFALYTTCKANTLLLPAGVEPEVYCTCYGNEYAKTFEGRKLFVSPQNMARAQSQAHAICSEGDFAEQNYGVP